MLLILVENEFRLVGIAYLVLYALLNMFLALAQLVLSLGNHLKNQTNAHVWNPVQHFQRLGQVRVLLNVEVHEGNNRILQRVLDFVELLLR